MMKRLGTTRGVPDYLLPVPRGGFSALWIEMKKPGGGVVSPEQRLFIERLIKERNRVIVCNTYAEAIIEIELYLGLPICEFA